MCERCEIKQDQLIVSHMFETKYNLEEQGYKVEELYYNKESGVIFCRAKNIQTDKQIKITGIVLAGGFLDG